MTKVRTRLTRTQRTTQIYEFIRAYRQLTNLEAEECRRCWQAGCREWQRVDAACRTHRGNCMALSRTGISARCSYQDLSHHHRQHSIQHHRLSQYISASNSSRIAVLHRWMVVWHASCPHQPSVNCVSVTIILLSLRFVCIISDILIWEFTRREKRTRWYFDAQASTWMAPPAAITHSNIWPCSDLDLHLSTFKTKTVRLSPQLQQLSKLGEIPSVGLQDHVLTGRKPGHTKERTHWHTTRKHIVFATPVDGININRHLWMRSRFIIPVHCLSLENMKYNDSTLDVRADTVADFSHLRRKYRIFGPGRRVPKRYCSCCWNQFSKNP